MAKCSALMELWEAQPQAPCTSEVRNVTITLLKGGFAWKDVANGAITCYLRHAHCGMLLVIVLNNTWKSAHSLSLADLKCSAHGCSFAGLRYFTEGILCNCHWVPSRLELWGLKASSQVVVYPISQEFCRKHKWVKCRDTSKGTHPPLRQTRKVHRPWILFH